MLRFFGLTRNLIAAESDPEYSGHAQAVLGDDGRQKLPDAVCASRNRAPTEPHQQEAKFPAHRCSG
jgi:hypothetical protein